MIINNYKKKGIIIIGFLLFNLAFTITTYDLNLLDYSEEHFYKLNELIGTKLDSIEAKIYEYDSLNEFIKSTGAPFFITAFSNKQGIHIQSRYLLGDRFQSAMIHELIHFTIKMQYRVPAWYEEGLVCLITQEFSKVTDIIPMRNVEEYDIRNAENNWELISYCLGCIEKVQNTLSSEPGKQVIP
ncbi:MAG: hypothetical protein ACOCUT_03030 [bacterium]